MKKLCSSFLVVERKYWTFGVIFLSKFLKSATYGRNGTFWCFFFGKKSNCLIVFGLWVKITVIWQKIWHLAVSLKVHFTCPQQNVEKKRMKVIHTIIISFGILREFFSDFVKKMFRRVETVIKCTEGKTSKNTHDKLVFRFSWILTRKTCSFTGKFLAGLSKLLSTRPKEPLKSNITERKSWKLQDFRIIFEVFGKMTEKFYQGWQNSNRCPRDHFMKTFFQKRDIRYFFRFWAIFLLLAKTFARFAKPAI